MSHIHHSCDCLVLPAPRVPARWHAILNVIVLVLEAFEEAAEMRRAVHRKYPFDNE
jgi:hypothetical protein